MPNFMPPLQLELSCAARVNVMSDWNALLRRPAVAAAAVERGLGEARCLRASRDWYGCS